MVPATNLPVAVAAQRRLVLESLRRFGPLAVSEIPRSWPVTREHVAGIVAGLREEGAVTLEWDRRIPGVRRARLTAEGERLLAGLDDAALTSLSESEAAA